MFCDTNSEYAPNILIPSSLKGLTYISLSQECSVHHTLDSQKRFFTSVNVL